MNYLDGGVGKPLPEDIVVAVRDVEELHPASPQVLDGGDDVERPRNKIFLFLRNLYFVPTGRRGKAID